MKRLRRFRRMVALAGAILLSMVVGLADASAQPEILRPSDRPHFFLGGVGPNFYAFNRGCGGFRNRYICRRTSLKVAMDYGYHFSGRFEGPAIGASLEQTFDDGLYTFNPAFKFWWDIEIAGHSIYVTPWAKAGYMLGSDFINDDRFITNTVHGFNIGVGVEGRVILHNRGLLFLRPVHLDTFLGDFPGDEIFVLNWSVLIGGGVVWD